MKEKIELNITDNQFSQINNVIRKYSRGYREIWDNNEKRHSFEREFTKINSVFETNREAVAIILKEVAEKVNCPNYKLLFIRLYGHMSEYENVFPEMGLE